MEFKDFGIGPDDEGRTFAKVAKSLLEREGSRDRNAFRLMRKGLVRLRGRRAGAGEILSRGDVIQAASFLLVENSAKAERRSASGMPAAKAIDSMTVFRNEFILVLNKPSGMSAQPGGAGLSLAEMVLADYGERGMGGSISFSPGPLHRIDRLTSGLSAFSQNLEGARWFSGAMRSREIRKRYIGIAEGSLCESGGALVLSNRIDALSGGGKKFHAVRVLPKDAGTEFPLAETRAAAISLGEFSGEAVTLAEFSISTGRKHQIRAQSAFAGHPLLGDTAYGARPRGFKSGFFLHALELEFPRGNPAGLPERLRAPIPDEFAAFMRGAFPAEDIASILEGHK